MKITCDSLTVELRRAGFKLTALHESVVVAEQPIAGHLGSYRVVHFTAGRDDWSGVCRVKRRHWASLEWQYDPPLSERRCLVEMEQVELWIAGAISVPLDAAEVAALEARAA